MMVGITELWWIILLAGTLCWVMSALVHMVFKYHNADYSQLKTEAEISAALGSPEPALYTMPFCKDMKEMGEESMQQKFIAGPVAMITVMPNGLPPMGKLLAMQIVFFIAGSLLLACLATMVLPAGAAYLTVFKFVFLAAFLCYGWGQIPYSIWLGQPWSNCLRYMIDAALYAGVSAGVFASLWPAVS